MLLESSSSFVCDIEITPRVTRIVNDFIIKFWNIYHNIVRATREARFASFSSNSILNDIIFIHTFPWHIIVKWATARTSAYSGRGTGSNICIYIIIWVISFCNTSKRGRRIRICPYYTKNFSII